ncbi:MAG: 2-hydroxychromene-2-carboxylate isomerase [Rhodomicrobium sp.]|nr:2-hydroxychromene-2-carboxylate isomerase [Rhodomicrobium sp.]
MPKLDFWYEFASTYSYLSAMRIETLAAGRGVTLAWKPFLLGPIFQAQGWTTSPFRLYPNKGRYMVRDIERIAASRGLGFKLGEQFPQNGLIAARLAMIAAAEGWAPAFTREVYLRQFRDGADISDKAVLADVLRTVGQDAAAMLARAQDQAVKDALKDQTTAAVALGIFGAPSFVTADGELFWGDDRLEHALDWAVSKAGGEAIA